MNKARTCITCMKRTESECSHIDCPNRKAITAQPVGGTYQVRPREVAHAMPYGTEGSFRRYPTNSEID